MSVAPVGMNPNSYPDFKSRTPLLYASVGEAALGAALFLSFWAAYGWTFILIIFLFVSAGLGICHFKTAYDASYSSCCCMPSSARVSMLILCILICIGSAFGCITSGLASFYLDTTFQVFSIINLITLVAIFALEIAKIVFIVRFKAEFEAGGEPSNGNNNFNNNNNNYNNNNNNGGGYNNGMQGPVVGTAIAMNHNNNGGYDNNNINNNYGNNTGFNYNNGANNGNGNNNNNNMGYNDNSGYGNNGNTLGYSTTNNNNNNNNNYGNNNGMNAPHYPYPDTQPVYATHAQPYQGGGEHQMAPTPQNPIQQEQQQQQQQPQQQQQHQGGCSVNNNGGIPLPQGYT